MLVLVYTTASSVRCFLQSLLIYRVRNHYKLRRWTFHLFHSTSILDGNSCEAKNSELLELQVDKSTKAARRSRKPENEFDNPRYYFENGLRKVQPYYYTFYRYIKPEWKGMRIYDVYQQQFLAIGKDLAYLDQLFNSGKISVNSEPVNSDYVIQKNDIMWTRLHRHEEPVLDRPINVLHLSDDLIVVNKPPSIPVHPCGRYRHNTVVYLLAYQHHFQHSTLSVCNRLDRMTSGVLLIGRTREKTMELAKQIHDRKVVKEYVCRVEGHFPSGSVVCEEPIRILRNFSVVPSKVCSEGKPCRTEFRALSYGDNTSVVQCRPLTGRTHQIRVHLQFLGYPIVNDPIYNSERFGPLKGKGGVFDKSDQQLTDEYISTVLEKWKLRKDIVDHRRNVPEVDSAARYDVPEVDSTFDPHCFECRYKLDEPEPRELVLFLHALRYQGPDWSFETEMPVWVKPDWIDDGS